MTFLQKKAPSPPFPKTSPELAAQQLLHLAKLLKCPSPSKKNPSKAAANWARQAEQTGPNALASQVLWARCCSIGYGVPLNEDLAFQWFFKASATCASLEKQAKLVALKENSETKPNECKSKKKSNEKNKERVQVFKGKNSKGKNSEIEEEYSDTSSEEKIPGRILMAAAYYGLGEAYYYGRGVAVHYNEAFQWLRRSAQHGCLRAQYRVASMYDIGEGHIRNLPRALGWYTCAAEETNDLRAWTRCGSMHECGEGTRVNLDRAKECYVRAARCGYLPACVQLTILMLEPQLTSLEDLKQQADLSTPAAMHNYAMALLRGRYGPLPHPVEARRWFRKAALRGLAESQYMLGRLYHDPNQTVGGVTLRLSATKAVHWYREAAARGHRAAAWRLAECIRKGTGVDCDFAQADHWERRAKADCSLVFDKKQLDEFEGFVAPQFQTPQSHSVLPRSTGNTRNLSPYLCGEIVTEAQPLEEYLIDPLEPYRSWPAPLDLPPWALTVQPEIYPPSRTPAGLDADAELPFQTTLSFDKSDIRSATDMKSLVAALEAYERTPSNSPEADIYPRTSLQILQRYAYSPTVSRLINARIILTKARSYAEAGKHYDAVHNFLVGLSLSRCSGAPAGCEAMRFLAAFSAQHVLAAQPDHPVALYVLAVISAGRHPYEYGLHICNRLLATLRSEPALYALRARFLARIGRYASAVSDCDKAISLYEGPVPRQSGRGDTRERDTPISFLLPPVSITNLYVQLIYLRGICRGNLPSEEAVRLSMSDMRSYLSKVPPDVEQAADAYYALSAGHLLCAKMGPAQEQDGNLLAADIYHKHGLLAEARRFPFMAPVANKAFKARLLLELKYAKLLRVPRTLPWEMTPIDILIQIEGDEPDRSISRLCLACGITGKTRTCARCKTARYCGGGCQIAHWQNGHAAECQATKMGC